MIGDVLFVFGAGKPWFVILDLVRSDCMDIYRLWLDPRHLNISR